MKESARAGLAPLETQRNHWGLQRSLRSNHRAREEARASLPVMANTPTALRAYILADAALVRGNLTLRQRAQVARAEMQIKRCHVNDPLAIGIEEFLWPFRSAPSRRALCRTPKRKQK